MLAVQCGCDVNCVDVVSVNTCVCVPCMCVVGSMVCTSCGVVVVLMVVLGVHYVMVVAHLSVCVGAICVVF